MLRDGENPGNASVAVANPYDPRMPRPLRPQLGGLRNVVAADLRWARKGVARTILFTRRAEWRAGAPLTSRSTSIHFPDTSTWLRSFGTIE